MPSYSMQQVAVNIEKQLAAALKTKLKEARSKQQGAVNSNKQQEVTNKQHPSSCEFKVVNWSYY